MKRIRMINTLGAAARSQTARKTICVWCCAALACGVVAADEPRATDHRRVMYYADDEGRQHPVVSRAEWTPRRIDIIAGIEAVMGPLPSRKDLGTSLSYETEPGSRSVVRGVIRERILIPIDAGDRIPAWLMWPENHGGSMLGILALHQTNGELGKDEVAGIGGSPNLHYGLELAERGYVVIAPDYPSLGTYAYDFDKDQFASGSMKGIWNHMRCIDVLCTFPGVDRERVGVIGHSLGGHNAIFLAAFDQRVKAVVSSCGWTPFHDYYKGDLTGWAGERYVPRIRDVYSLDPNRVPWDFYEAIAAIAPRAFLSVSPLHDPNFDVAGVKKAIPVAREVYELFGAADRLQAIYPDCGHDFPEDARETAYQFIDEMLKSAKVRPPADFGQPR